jgi:hypothetical protein
MEAELSDAELIAAFEERLLPPQAWNHCAHVRVAFIYASQYGFEAALAQMRVGLHALNAAHRVPNAADRGYHETITVAFMRLVFAACKQQQFSSSVDFCHAHSELMTKDALLHYYSRERLTSVAAKAAFIEPDVRPLPA